MTPQSPSPSNINATNDNIGGLTAVLRDNNASNGGVIGNGSNNAINHGVIFNIGQMRSDFDELERLGSSQYISRDALHHSKGSPPTCHPGTRAAVLRQVEDWIYNARADSGEPASPVLWIYGPAGVGKSVIAKTIADHVIATFFFSASSNKSGETLFPTLAWQLACKYPQARRHFLDSLKNNSRLLESEIEKQFNLLLIEPLNRVTVAAPMRGFVMIIDGVDECTDNDMKHRFLELLERFSESGEKRLRFLISSRPEPTIRAALQKTHTASAFDLSTRSSTQSRDQTIRAQPREWIAQYGLNVLGFLKEYRPRHLFKLLEEARRLYQPLQAKDLETHVPPVPSEDPDRIHHHPMVSRIQIGYSHISTEDIEFYLRNTLRVKGEDWDSSFTPDNLRRLLGILVVFSENVHFAKIEGNFPIIESTLNLPKGTLITKLSKMHSLLKVVPGESVSVYHRSFLEFLQHKSRSTSYHIPYPSALWRFFALVRNSVLRYALKNFWGQLSDEDHGDLERLHEMVLTFPRNLFRRSSNPTFFASLHILAHAGLDFLAWVPLYSYTRWFWPHLVNTFTPLPILASLIHYPLGVVLSSSVISYGTFTLSSAYYQLGWNCTVIRPFFHPFFNPYLPRFLGFFLSLGRRDTRLILAHIFWYPLLFVAESTATAQTAEEESGWEGDLPGAASGMVQLIVLSDGKKLYDCKCGYTSQRKVEMIMHHQSLWHAERRHKCWGCGDVYTRDDVLERHKKKCRHLRIYHDDRNLNKDAS